MPFAVLVVGSPGAGKSTFCHGMQQLYQQLQRKCVLVNLDPANDALPYECGFDICTLVNFDSVCKEEGIGPNNAFLRCMELVESKVDLIRQALKEFEEDSIFFFDCPGQIELYSLHTSMLNIVNELHEFSFSVANILDSTQMKDLSSFLAVSLVTLNAMLHLDLPQVNFLNKFDLVLELPSPLEHYCFADLQSLFEEDEQFKERQKRKSKHAKLTAAIIELFEEHSLVSFVPLAVEDKDCMVFAMGELDRISGHVFGALSAGNDCLTEAAFSSSHFSDYLLFIQDRYLNTNSENN